MTGPEGAFAEMEVLSPSSGWQFHCHSNQLWGKKLMSWQFPRAPTGFVITGSGGSQNINGQISNMLPSTAHFVPGTLSPRTHQVLPGTRQMSTGGYQTGVTKRGLPNSTDYWGAMGPSLLTVQAVTWLGNSSGWVRDAASAPALQLLDPSFQLLCTQSPPPWGFLGSHSVPPTSSLWLRTKFWNWVSLNSFIKGGKLLPYYTDQHPSLPTHVWSWLSSPWVLSYSQDNAWHVADAKSLGSLRCSLLSKDERVRK